MNALVMTLLPNKSALSSRLLSNGDGGAGCALNRKLSTGGGAFDCDEKADEKSANSLATAGAAAFGGAAEPDPKADEKSPKSAEASSARGSKSSSGSDVGELKISSIISLLLFAVVLITTGASPNKSSLCELRCVGELIPKSLALP